MMQVAPKHDDGRLPMGTGEELGPPLYPRDMCTLPNKVRFIFIISARQKTVCADQHFFFLGGFETFAR